MEVISVRGSEFKVTTLTKATVFISTEIRDLLEEGFNVAFEDGMYATFSSTYTIREILDNLEEYKEDWCLSEQDIEDLQCIAELLTKVDFLELERAL